MPYDYVIIYVRFLCEDFIRDNTQCGYDWSLRLFLPDRDFSRLTVHDRILSSREPLPFTRWFPNKIIRIAVAYDIVIISSEYATFSVIDRTPFVMVFAWYKEYRLLVLLLNVFYRYAYNMLVLTCPSTLARWAKKSRMR